MHMNVNRRVTNCVNLRSEAEPPVFVLTVILQYTDIIKYSIFVITELFKLVHFLPLLSPVSTRVNHFEWRGDLLLML